MKEDAIGSFYIKKDNSIGLNLEYQNQKLIKKIILFIKKNYKPLKSIPSEIPPYFYINVSKSNLYLQKMLGKINLNAIQISYKV